MAVGGICHFTVDGKYVAFDGSESGLFIDHFNIQRGGEVLLGLYCETNGVTYPVDVSAYRMYVLANHLGRQLVLTSKWVAEISTLDTQVLIDIANAIRTRIGYAGVLSPNQFKDYINASKIEFRYEGTAFNAVSGMTWGDFVKSPFNQGVFSIQFDYYIVCSGYRVLNSANAMLSINDTIVSGMSYKRSDVMIDY